MIQLVRDEQRSQPFPSLLQVACFINDNMSIIVIRIWILCVCGPYKIYTVW